MEFFTELSDRAAEQISGGKNDQWLQEPITTIVYGLAILTKP